MNCSYRLAGNLLVLTLCFLEDVVAPEVAADDDDMDGANVLEMAESNTGGSGNFARSGWECSGLR